MIAFKFKVVDTEGKEVSARDVMFRHSDFFGEPSQDQIFVFAIGEDGELMTLAGEMPIRFACTLNAFRDLYTIIWRME